MAESQNGTSSTVGSKKKSPLLDEEIGGDFLNSWKSTTVGEGALDFNCEAVPQGRKNTFNFDKMNIDFALDGDFDKISSFKMDMSDLDFSSPPRKAEKPKERSGKESLLGKEERKQDRFTFSFDFNELDGFDLDSSLLKREKKSDKVAVNKALDSPIKHVKGQHSISNAATSSDKLEISGTKKLPTLDSGTTSKFDHLVSSHVDIDTFPGCKNPGNQNVSPDAATFPEKQITTAAQEGSRECNEAQLHREKSEMIASVEPYAQHAIQDTSAQSVSDGDSVLQNVPKLQTGLCSLDAEADTKSCREPDHSVKSIVSSQSRNSSPVNSYNPKGLTPTGTRESQNSDTEFQKDSGSQNHVARGNKTRIESTQAKISVQDAPIKPISQKLHAMKDTGENLNSIPKVLLTPLRRESRLDKLVTMKEKETDAVHSKYFSKSEDTKSQLSSPPAAKKMYAFCGKKMEGMHLGPTDGKSHEFRESDEQAGIQKVGTLKSLSRPVTKGLSVILGSEKNEKERDTSRFEVNPVNLPVHTVPSSTPKSINTKLVLSSIVPIKNPKITSVERPKLSPLNVDKKKNEIASLKISRNITSKSEPSKSMFNKERESVKHSERNMGTYVNMGCKMVHSVNMDKLALLSTSLKRKSFEGSNADSVTFNPLKRATESPTESRKVWEDPQRTEEKRASLSKEFHASAENLEDQHGDICYGQPTSPLDLPLEASMTDLEVQILTESDGNVEKAEACAKELEDICNMLRKKHEEAKELLVRAIVNNNQLLMLNHPIYEEKIRTIQRYAACMLSQQNQP
ncbi:uncharacterized protein At4g18490 isoform X2 [Magnolia sinica]|uniref:uncharacterized protein At4g18490 isoform X2 n=1 Tax=Magnolia sinica TaxID=86752 RepID=UPI00265B3A31|nr:uncharacterized protein At4g18490 isoform X2 [Magnolia sinica]